MKRAIRALALIFAASLMPSAGADSAQDVTKSRFSEKAVPRFETLKYNLVRGRKGPSQDYAVRFEYTQKGLPVRVLKESGTWYFVEDPSGDQVWIDASQLTDKRRTAMALEDFTLKAGRAADSPGIALIGKGRLVELGDCDATRCQIEADRFRGWAPRELLWGATATKG